jgi:hypothetical protein
MSSIESTNAVSLGPDVDNLIFDFMITTTGHEVVDVNIFSLGQNSLVIDVPVDWRDCHIERHTERLLRQDMRRLAHYATNRVNQCSRQLLSKGSDSTQRI